MDKYVVKITEDAYADMECIYDGILRLTQSKKIAMQQYDLLVEAIMSLQNFPYATKALEIVDFEDYPLRRMVVNKYSVVLIIKGHEVIVTNVIYSSGKFMSKLLGYG
ncbi:MAG: hypothetical protein MJ048_05660 [Acidaminococcaceae bacterium]|nr:hypothetical protein [Acidaminococcaceae bacterium]